MVSHSDWNTCLHYHLHSNRLIHKLGKNRSLFHSCFGLVLCGWCSTGNTVHRWLRVVPVFAHRYSCRSLSVVVDRKSQSVLIFHRIRKISVSSRSSNWIRVEDIAGWSLMDSFWYRVRGIHSDTIFNQQFILQSIHTNWFTEFQKICLQYHF